MDDNEDWIITIQRRDGLVAVSADYPNDELEYGVDDVLREARRQEAQIRHPAGKNNDGAVV